MNNRLDEIKLYYHEVLTVWEGFCHLHKSLYDLTCDEYMTLLESDIEKLESMLPLKEEIIAKISELERQRTNLIEKINQAKIFNQEISKASHLLGSFASYEEATGLLALNNLNDLLIDIIHKIQDQNKKNQMFLNKAMISIREIKQGFTGKKNFTTYGADGMTRTIGR